MTHRLQEYRPPTLSLESAGGIELGTVRVYKLAACNIVACSLVNAAQGGDGEEEGCTHSSREHQEKHEILVAAPTSTSCHVVYRSPRSHACGCRPDKPGFLVGANMLEVSSIGIALCLLSDNASIVADAHDCVHNEVQAQSGFQLDGIHQDGSFSQHQGLLYNGLAVSNDVWELEIEAGGTCFAATGPSRTTFENLMNVSQWMIYQNTLRPFFFLTTTTAYPFEHTDLNGSSGYQTESSTDLTQLPTSSTVLKKTSTHEDSSSRTRPRLGPAPTETLTTNPSSHSRLTKKGLEYQIQVEADKQQLAPQRERRLACEEEARALDAEVAALRDEGLGDEEIAEFLSDPNTNDSEDEPGPQTRPGRMQVNKFAFKATMAVVTAASKPSVSNAVRRQTASSPIPLRAHAGFPNIVTNPRKLAFNAAKFARAAQALDDNEHSDS
ncbi:hypothetical protein JB92DRAFT_2835239 [Gautieria morchelliformis]|nr:hypothetical protein JB92DRAFT_2835239 [Gautieria morchelliformis]